jgi:hypothetical protein
MLRMGQRVKVQKGKITRYIDHVSRCERTHPPLTTLDLSNKMETKRYDDKHIDSSEHLDRSTGAEVSDAKKLINPLHGISKEQLLADVDQFCAETGMTEHTDVFRRGALVAQRPEEYEEIPELTEDDLFWLRKSTASKWSHPKMLYFTGTFSHFSLFEFG